MRFIRNYIVKIIRGINVFDTRACRSGYANVIAAAHISILANNGDIDLTSHGGHDHGEVRLHWFGMEVTAIEMPH